jgi:hypothetical protein
VTRLFHGTAAFLRPGDVIAPRTKGLAYATPDRATARAFARGGWVYEVEPVDPASCVERQVPSTGSEVHREVVSPAGFRVVARA